jgi:hypothetical protein
MASMHSAMVLSLVTLVFIIIVLKFPEQFTNYLNNQQKNNSNLNYVSNDISNLEQSELVPDNLEDEVKDIIDEILENYNKLYNKKLIRVEIERLEKSVDESNNLNNFSVVLFVFNYLKESNAKMLVEFSLDSENHIKVNKMKVLGSKQSLIKVRGGETTRDNNTDIKKHQVDMDKVDNLLEIPLDFSLFNETETKNKMVDRHSWILPEARIKIGNIETFPSRNMNQEWGCNGVNFVDHEKKGTPGGINYGSRPFTLVPHFMKNNFEACYGEYPWLFDKAEDVESRPIGVG